MAVIGTDRQTLQDKEKRPGKQSSKRPARRLWLWLALTVLLAAAATGGWWWQARQSVSAAQTIYTTVSVTPAAYDLTISGPGTLSAAQSVSVSTPVAGTIQRLASVGDKVEKGQTLAQLEPDTLQEAVTEAQLGLEQAQAELESLRLGQTDSSGGRSSAVAEAQRAVSEAQRSVQTTQQELSLAEQLREVGSGSAAEVQTAQNAYDTAVATLDNAQDTLDTLSTTQTLQSDADTQNLKNAELAVTLAQLTLDRAERDLADATITAPIAGVVTAISDESTSDTSSTIQIQAGTTLSAGQTLLTLSNYETIELAAQVDETQISGVRVGQAATVTADAVNEQAFAGEVTAVSPSATVEDNIPIFEVTVQIANPELGLRPGMTAEANIAVETLQNTLSVPTAAVQTFGDRSVVELEQTGRAVPLPVEVVGTDGLNTIIQIAEAPAGTPADADTSTDTQDRTPNRTVEAAATGTGENPDAETASARPDLSTLLSDGEAVTVRVPGSGTASDTEASGDADTRGGGFGGPPGAGFGGGGGPR